MTKTVIAAWKSQRVGRVETDISKAVYENHFWVAGLKCLFCENNGMIQSISYIINIPLRMIFYYRKDRIGTDVLLTLQRTGMQGEISLSTL